MTFEELRRRKRRRTITRVSFLTLLEGLKHQTGCVKDLVESNTINPLSQEVLLASLEYLNTESQ